ncbi:selenide, water dikinase SelD [Mycoplasmatota bacterium]|nr:selenide, water dikinase SelD [Mycoplasmatota bacterium]
MVSNLPQQIDEKLICGLENSEDGAVYELDSENYLVSTLDFFSPNISDPYTFGLIAAANALSDIFAMGGEILYALNILSFPSEVEEEAITEILKGAIHNVNKAGGVVVGGHTTKNNEIVYGLSVTGKVKRKSIMLNSNAKVNNKIILTKKIGTGIYMSELSKGSDDYKEVVESMTTLNKEAADIMMNYNVSTCTDLTGFGLIGHLSEVAVASDLSLNIYFDKLPLFDRTLELVNNTNGGMLRNIEHFSKYVNYENIKKENINILADPQTSGGLFIFVDEQDADELLKELQDKGITQARVIGETIEKGDSFINIL